jgi:GrpB-like predicted nucleotidyltransferase (UPF0157 family)
MRKVEVVPYEQGWATEAALEIERLREALGEVALEIHHIGSTAVPGLSAKPTLDLLLVVRSLEELEAHEGALVALGYEPRGEAGIPGRRYYRIRQGEAHTHHVHGWPKDHPEIARHLDFRDALRADPDLARDYSELKQQLAARFPRNASAYGEAKTAFIMGVVEKPELCPSQLARTLRSGRESHTR